MHKKTLNSFNAAERPLILWQMLKYQMPKFRGTLEPGDIQILEGMATTQILIPKYHYLVEFPFYLTLEEINKRFEDAALDYQYLSRRDAVWG